MPGVWQFELMLGVWQLYWAEANATASSCTASGFLGVGIYDISLWQGLQRNRKWGATRAIHCTWARMCKLRPPHCVERVLVFHTQFQLPIWLVLAIRRDDCLCCSL